MIETAKLNVITAYSSAEAIELLERFPAVNGVVVDAGVDEMPTDELVRKLKEQQPNLPVIVIAAPGFEDASDADFHLDSFQPAKLLELLQKLQPKETSAIERRDEDLSREQGGN